MRIQVVAAVFSAILFPSVHSAAAATVSGKVEILDKGDVRRQNGSNVVVWLLRADGTTFAGWPPQQTKQETPVRFEMVSRDKAFQPPLLVVPVGAEVGFPNVDPIFHNVFSLSGENRFDLGLYKSGKSKSLRFQKPGLVRVYCNIHSQMVGFIHVMDTPYYMITKAEGLFTFRDVGPGRYVVKAWEEKAGDVSTGLTLSRVDAPPITISLDARGFAPQSHLNKFGKQYTVRSDDDERY